MDSRRWAQINALFAQLVDLPPEDQPREIAQLQDIYDPDILREVGDLLVEANRLEDDFLEMPEEDNLLAILLWVLDDEL